MRRGASAGRQLSTLSRGRVGGASTPPPRHCLSGLQGHPLLRVALVHMVRFRPLQGFDFAQGEDWRTPPASGTTRCRAWHGRAPAQVVHPLAGASVSAFNFVPPIFRVG
eukprot:2071032-Pyramimonas_sp.AAC.1